MNERRHEQQHLNNNVSVTSLNWHSRLLLWVIHIWLSVDKATQVAITNKQTLMNLVATCSPERITNWQLSCCYTRQWHTWLSPSHVCQPWSLHYREVDRGISINVTCQTPVNVALSVYMRMQWPQLATPMLRTVVIFTACNAAQQCSIRVTAMQHHNATQHHDAAPRCSITMQHHDAAPRCSTTMQHHDAAPRCSTTMQHHDAAPRCSTTMQHHDAASRCSTTMQHHDAAPRCSTTMQHHDAAPRCSTTMQHHDAAPRCSTTMQHHDAAPRCSTTMQHHNAAPQHNTTTPQYSITMGCIVVLYCEVLWVTQTKTN